MSAFRIDWKFGKLGMPKSELVPIFEGAEERWSFVITGWPTTSGGTPVMKALSISVATADLNNGRKKGNLALARTEIGKRVPGRAGPAAGIPTHARILLDENQFPAAIEDRPEVIRDIIAHEIGHALGFGTCKPERFVKEEGRNIFFTGPFATKEYAKIRRAGGAVPLESSGNSRTVGKHWDEDEQDMTRLGRILVYELMSGNFQDGDNRLTRLTVAAMRDLGYEVDMDAAENYRDAD